MISNRVKLKEERELKKLRKFTLIQCYSCFSSNLLTILQYLKPFLHVGIRAQQIGIHYHYHFSYHYHPRRINFLLNKRLKPTLCKLISHGIVWRIFFFFLWSSSWPSYQHQLFLTFFFDDTLAFTLFVCLFFFNCFKPF